MEQNKGKSKKSKGKTTTQKLKLKKLFTFSRFAGSRQIINT